MIRSDLSQNQLSDFIAWFNSFYTREKRVGLHLLMWLIFSVIMEFGLILSYDFSFHTSAFYLVSSLTANFLVFYPFFYFIYPRFMIRKKFVAGILLVIGLILLWRINGYLAKLVMYHYAHIENAFKREQVNDAMNHSFFFIFSLQSLIGSFIDILYSLAPVFCLKITVDTLKSAYRSTEIEKEKSILEVAFLKSQLNPHFLFNTLNSIYILNMKADEAASDMILELSDTLRYTLYESNTEKVLLEKELAFLENYVNLERVRQNERTRIDFNCNLEGVGTLSVAPLLTFPFIENAFKHGLGTSLKDAWLEINIGVLKGVFYCKIRNSKNDEYNGVPVSDYSGGIGVGNTKKRLALLYPGKHVLEIANTPDDYSIDLKINLNE